MRYWHRPLLQIGVGILLLVGGPIALFANTETTENIGFVDGLWYAQNPVFAEVPTRIYVAFRNTSESDVVTTVRFADNGKRIDSVEVQALSGRLIEAWVDWKPTYGTHTLTVTLGNTTLHSLGKESKQIDTSALVIEETLEIDYDTDNDRIPNKEDPDDDNDGVSDTTEKERGSNPLVADPRTEEKDERKEPTRARTATNAQPTLSDDDSVSITRTSAEGKRGLEQYLGSGIGNTLLGNVTEKVHTAKQSLDTYRSERNESLYNSANEVAMSDMATTTLDGETATITRSKIDTSKNSFLTAFIDGVRSILQNIWTFVLFLLSKILAHPALIQVLLLLGILCIMYYLLRRIGRRPQI